MPPAAYPHPSASVTSSPFPITTASDAGADTMKSNEFSADDTGERKKSCSRRAVPHYTARCSKSWTHRDCAILVGEGANVGMQGEILHRRQRRREATKRLFACCWRRVHGTGAHKVMSPSTSLGGPWGMEAGTESGHSRGNSASLGSSLPFRARANL